LLFVLRFLKSTFERIMAIECCLSIPTPIENLNELRLENGDIIGNLDNYFYLNNYV
jgi:hypothetical protein